MKTHIFTNGLAEHLDDITTLGVCRAEALRPSNKYAVVDPVLANPPGQDSGAASIVSLTGKGKRTSSDRLDQQ